MKIMIVSDLAPPAMGGAENYVINLGSRLVKSGHEVHWLTSRLPGTPKSEIFQGMKIHRVPILFPHKYLFPGRQSFSATSLLPAIKLAKKMDVIQSNSFVAGILGWLIAKLAGKPSVLFCHEMYGELWKDIGQNQLEKHLYPLAEKFMSRSPYDWFICPSRYSKTSLIKQGAPVNKITVVPHGVEFSEKALDKDYRSKFDLKGSPTIGYIGRLNIKKSSQAKNIKTLLETVRILSQRIPKLKLILVGKGFEDLAPIIRDLNIQDNVIYLGSVPQSEIQNFYNACNVVVCPALSDGFCFLLAEASACGVPTVATKRGSHSERILHNKTGLLASETPDDLADKVMKILEDRHLAGEMGKESIRYSKNFPWRTSVDKHLEIYKNLIFQK